MDLLTDRDSRMFKALTVIFIVAATFGIMCFMWEHKDTAITAELITGNPAYLSITLALLLTPLFLFTLFLWNWWVSHRREKRMYEGKQLSYLYSKRRNIK